ncbi:MAG: TlpA family protein disulfide reductase [Bacteroidetes bacterium]|nr:TlpA family protein disulfide reductase [Bacteroidota bacterium]
MRKTVRIIAVLWILVQTLHAQNHVVIAPPEPMQGVAITISYDAGAPGAVLNRASQIAAEYLQFSDDGTPTISESVMKKMGLRWISTVNLDPKAILIQVRFTDGEKNDDNGENVWTVALRDAAGSPLPSAGRLKAQFLLFNGVPGFKVKRDPDAGMKLLAETVERFPDDWRTQAMYWNALLRSKAPNAAQMISTSLERLRRVHAEDEEATATLLSIYDRIGAKTTGDSLRALELAKHPEGVLAQLTKQNNAMMERDAAKRLPVLEELLKAPSYPEAQRKLLENQFIATAIRAGAYERAFTAIETATRLDMSVPMSMNDAAWSMAETNTSLDTTSMLAQRAIAILRKNGKLEKPGYMSTRDWDRSRASSLGMVLDTYGFILTKQGNHAKAVAAFEEAVELLGGKEAEINERYISALNETERYDTALKRSADFIRKGSSNDGMIAQYRKAYVAKHGTANGFDDQLATLTGAAQDAHRAEVVKSMIDKPAIPFALKDLKGTTVSLESVKGKVVVVDFWATWCGPCKASFPFLQKVYEKYRQDPSVVILAVNTWENKKGQEREDLVRKFMADNKYTFPVLFDEGFVEKFGVEGIPTKFVLDGTGRIRFKSVGFNGGEKMIAELTAQIELLRKGGSRKK